MSGFLFAKTSVSDWKKPVVGLPQTVRVAGPLFTEVSLFSFADFW
jgi:hypothetical protein